MKLSFTTLGCPDWDLDTICAKGSEYGYDGVDFRGLQETMDVTQLPAFTSDIAETRAKLQDAGLEVSGISSSIRVCVPEKLEDHLEEARAGLGGGERHAGRVDELAGFHTFVVGEGAQCGLEQSRVPL